MRIKVFLLSFSLNSKIKFEKKKFKYFFRTKHSLKPIEIKNEKGGNFSIIICGNDYISSDHSHHINFPISYIILTECMHAWIISMEFFENGQFYIYIEVTFYYPSLKEILVVKSKYIHMGEP